jgi:carboxymethylenebutenolidase
MASQGEMVEFQAGGRAARGYLVTPGGGAARPALVVIHEWWGLNDHIKDIAERFAGEGYVVLAVDLYDGKTTKDAGEAGRLMQSLDQERAAAILNGAVEHLKGRPEVDAGRIGATGFCMGGTFALLLASRNKDIKASAPFYGDVPPDDELKNLASPVLFIGAGRDEWITRDKMDRLAHAMERFGKEGEVKVYEDAGHAFFNDTRAEAYDKEAARDAWERVTRFFADRLGAGA